MSKFLIGLNELIEAKKEIIDSWIVTKKRDREWPVYHSLDLRISTHKVCHVDSNLFPGGFNNLSGGGVAKAKNEFTKLIAAKKYRNILVVTEDFTRNLPYIDNVKTIVAILDPAKGVDVRVAPLKASGLGSVELENGLCQIQREGKRVFLMSEKGRWYPDFLLLNNDLTKEFPAMLGSLDQPIAPDLANGWFQRRKSNHFYHYNRLARELSELIGIDPFVITALMKVVDNVDFRSSQGLTELASVASGLIQDLKLLYVKHEIKDKACVFLKADRGTFGMGIMTASEADDILKINKKMRHSLSQIRGGVLNSQILIQEGLITTQRVDSAAAESMLYSINGEIVGEIIRYNKQKGEAENLNSKGMAFISVEDFDISQPAYFVKWLINKLAHLACLDELSNPEDIRVIGGAGGCWE